MNSLRQLGANNTNTGKNLEKLSSGYKINRAGDDAAGLAISEKMRGQIRGLEQAQNNANDGISLIQTAEGGLNETHSILQRMRELAVQSSNGTYQNAVDRENLQKEVSSLIEEIDRIASSTHFNKINLLDGSMEGYTTTVGTTLAGAVNVSVTGGDGNIDPTTSLSIEADAVGGVTDLSLGTAVTGISFTKLSGNDDVVIYKANVGDDATLEDANKWSGVQVTISIKDKTQLDDDTFTIDGSGEGVTFQIGANGASDQEVSLNIGNMKASGLGVDGVNIADRDVAKTAIDTIDAAINTVSATRADLGALQNRLEHTVNNLGVTSENLTAAESRIRDVDMAKEMMQYTKNNILTQAAQAMLAQANQQPQGVLQLLQ
jgi:flagellin